MISLWPAPPLREIYRSARSYPRHTFVYAPPSAERLARVQALFRTVAVSLAPGPPPRALVRQAKEVGFDLLRAAGDSGDVLWVLREPGEQRNANGLYALRAGGFPICVQAPHTFFDEGSGQAALELFRDMRAACFAINTVDRRKIDVAHAESSVYLSATLGLLEATRWPIIQLHGFGEGEKVPPTAKAVISSGCDSTTLTAALEPLLEPSYGEVLVYPRDTRVLGATTNRQGIAARAASIPFLHLEMSRNLRRTVAQNARPLAAALRRVLDGLPSAAAR